MLHRLVTHHPQSLGMGWAGHAAGAVRIGAAMIGGGVACLIHAVVPGWFTETAGRTVMRLHDHMQRRRASAPDWPDFEI